MSVIIRNTNENYGAPATFTGSTLPAAVAKMQVSIRECGPEFADVVVRPKDYEVLDVCASANFEDYAVSYMQHKTSGDVYAVQQCHDTGDVYYAGPLHHSEVRNIFDHDCDDQWEDWDETEYRALSEQDIVDRFCA